MLGDDKKSSTNINTNIHLTKIDLRLILKLTQNNLEKPLMMISYLELSNSIKNIGKIVPIIVRKSQRRINI